MTSPKEVSVIVRARDLTLDGLTRAKAGITSWANSVSGQLTQFFALEKLGGLVSDFFGRMKDEVVGAERASTQLGNTLGNIGIDLGKVRPEIDAAVAALQKVAAVDDDEAIAAFNKLVQITGNYHGSLKNLQLVADVAAAKQIDLSEAADLVGRVMMGTGGKALKEFGISTKDAALATEELRAKVKGAAETELGTLEGSLKAANVQLGEVAQAIGEVISKDGSFKGFIKGVIDRLRGIAEWVTANRTELRYWFAFAIAGGKEFISILADIVKAAFYLGQAIGFAGEAIVTMFSPEKNAAANKGLREALHGLNVALSHDLGGAWDRVEAAAEKSAQGQVKSLKQIREEIAKNKKALADNKRAHDEIAAADAADKAKPGKSAGDLKAAIEKRDREGAKTKDDDIAITDHHQLLGAAQNKADIAALVGNPKYDVDASIKGIKATDFAGPGPELSFGQRFGLALGDGTKDIDRSAAKMESLGKVIADIAAGPVLAFGDAMQNAFDAAISGSTTLGKAFLQSIGGAVRSVAALKGKLFAGEALAALGEGFLGHPGAFLAAAKYGLAAAAMFALAGAAGGIGQGGGGGGGASTPAAASARSQQQLAGVGQGNLTVILKGKKTVINHEDPDEQDAFVQMIKKVAGNRQVDFVVEGA